MGKYCWRRLIPMVTPQDWKSLMTVSKCWRTTVPLVNFLSLATLLSELKHNAAKIVIWPSMIWCNSVTSRINLALDWLFARLIVFPRQMQMKAAFFKGFLLKKLSPSSIILRIWLIGWTVLIKSEILIATGMVWPVSSDKREALSVNRNILYFDPHHNS